jgi:prepilin-type processing-associated H-X9-DG protein
MGCHGALLNEDMKCRLIKAPHLSQIATLAYHNNAAGISFADGHAEIKKWTDAGIIANKGTYFTKDPNSSDLPWLQERTTFQ